MKLSKVEITTAPAGVLFDFDEVRTHARIDRTDEDAVVTTYLRAAISMVEKWTGYVLNSTQYKGYLDNWSSEVEIELFPVASIDSIKYYNTAGTLSNALVDGTDYYYTLKDLPAKIYFEETYDLRDQIYDNIEIQFTAGYTSLYSMPEEVRNLVYIMTTYLYDNRGISFQAFNRGSLPYVIQQMIFDVKKSSWL